MNAYYEFAYFSGAFSKTTQSIPEVEERTISGVAYKECMVCCEVPASVKFEPCGHRIVCTDCCIKMKKCLTCQQTITKKIGRGNPF